jgi:hypothetical protein
MALAGNATLALATLGLMTGGAFLWAQFGSLVYFDMLASAFTGCFL